MRRRTWARVRLLGGVLILAAVVRQMGAGPFLQGLRGLGPGTLLAALALGAVTTICSAWRWRAVATSLGVGLPLPAATAAYYRSQLLNSVLPGGVLGDVHRGLRHGVDAGDLGRGVRAVVWERVAGQVVQAAIALAVLLTLPSPVHAGLPGVAAAAVLASAVLLAAGRGLLRRGPARVAGALRTAAAEGRRALLQPTAWPPVLLASALVVAGHLGMFLLAARTVGVPGSTEQVLPLALIVLLAAAIPLNIGGWGPREGAAAGIFAAAGWGAATGATVATAFGVLTLVAVLPGAVVLLAGRLRSGRRRARAAGDRPEPAPRMVHSGARGDGAAHG